MQFALVILLNTLAFSGMSSLLPVMPILLLAKGFSISATSIPFLAIIVARIFAKSFCRIFLRVEYKIVCIACFACYCAVFYFYAFVEGRVGFIVLRVLEGFIEGILIVVFTDIAMTLSNKSNRGFYMGIFGSSFALGLVLGPLYSGVLYAKFGMSSIFMLNAFLGVLAVVLSFFMKRYRMQKQEKFCFSKNVFRLISFYSPAILRRIYIFSFAIFLPIYLNKHLGESVEKTSQIFAELVLVIIVASPFAGKLADRISPKRLTIFSIILTVVFTFAIFVQASFYYAFFTMLIFFSLAVSAGAKLFLNKIEESPQRTEIIGLASSVADVSSLVVAVFIPILAEKSIHLPWLFLAFCGIVALVPLVESKKA